MPADTAMGQAIGVVLIIGFGFGRRGGHFGTMCATADRAACRGDTRRCGQKRRRECDPELGGNSVSRYQFLASQRYLAVKTE